jgi:hypothetical protein
VVESTSELVAVEALVSTGVCEAFLRGRGARDLRPVPLGFW